MKIRTDSFTRVILDEGLVHDYELELRMYNLFQIEDIRDYSRKRSLIYPNYC